MKISYILTVFFTLLFLNEYKLIKTVNIEGIFFKTDQLENVYIVNNQNIVKFNNIGTKLFTYNNNYLGAITYFDISDPLRILVFYKDFNQILFLDNTLSIIGSPILLDNLGYDQIELACSSNTGGFWIFNSQTNQLVLLDKNLQIKLQSVSINSILSGNNKPNYLIEKNDFIYLNIPETGIIIFDKFGSYYKTLPIKNINSFQVSENKITYFNNNKLINFDFELLIEKIINLPDTIDIKNALVEQNKLFLFKKNQFSIYQQNVK